MVITGSKIMPAIKFEAQSKLAGPEEEYTPPRQEEKEHKYSHDSNSGHALSPAKEGNIKVSGGISREEAEGGGVQPALLHSGPLLGNLPAFGKQQASPKKFQADLDAALNQSGNAPLHTSGLFGAPNSNINVKTPSKKADDKNAAKKKKKRPLDDVPKDTPPHFLCQLTQRPMSDPVKTIYGNRYDRTAILNWLSTQGKICPLTGEYPVVLCSIVVCTVSRQHVGRFLLCVFFMRCSGSVIVAQ